MHGKKNRIGPGTDWVGLGPISAVSGHRNFRMIMGGIDMKLRYNFRIYPTPGQRMALARAFGCARVVYNE